MPTYWAYLATDNLNTARAMLGEREKIPTERPDWIGSTPSVDGGSEDARIKAWMGKRHIEAAVWTALPPKFNGHNGYVATADEVIACLDGREAEELQSS